MQPEGVPGRGQEPAPVSLRWDREQLLCPRDVQGPGPSAGTALGACGGTMSLCWEKCRTKHPCSGMGFGRVPTAGQRSQPGKSLEGGSSVALAMCHHLHTMGTLTWMVPTLRDRPGWSVGHGEDVGGMRWRGPGTGASSWMKYGEDHTSPAPYCPPPQRRRKAEPPSFSKSLL